MVQSLRTITFFVAFMQKINTHTRRSILFNKRQVTAETGGGSFPQSLSPGLSLPVPLSRSFSRSRPGGSNQHCSHTDTTHPSLARSLTLTLSPSAPLSSVFVGTAGISPCLSPGLSPGFSPGLSPGLSRSHPCLLLTTRTAEYVY